MLPDNSRLEEAKEWLRVAADDLRLAEAALALDPPITGLALYHAQQTAEKALKGYLIFREHTFPFTHNLTELARPLAALDAALLEVVGPGLDLSNFATLYRYPGEPVLPTVDEAQPWIDAARAIWTAVVDRLNAQSTESVPDEGVVPGAAESPDRADGDTPDS